MSGVRSVQDAVGRWPALYVGLLHVKYRNHPFRERVVDRRTDVTIEGFPRSGNSFANRALASVQPDPIRIATHTHHAAQVRQSARMRKPTMVVVRDPAQSIPSLYALREEVRRTQPERPVVDIEASLERYVTFHDDVLAVAASILMVRFEDVITDYGQVIDRLNSRFGTTFVRFEHTAENVERLFAREKSHLSPSTDRAAEREMGAARFAQAPAALRARARDAYLRAADAAERSGGYER